MDGDRNTDDYDRRLWRLQTELLSMTRRVGGRLMWRVYVKLCANRKDECDWHKSKGEPWRRQKDESTDGLTDDGVVPYGLLDMERYRRRQSCDPKIRVTM